MERRQLALDCDPPKAIMVTVCWGNTRLCPFSSLTCSSWFWTPHSNVGNGTQKALVSLAVPSSGVMPLPTFCHGDQEWPGMAFLDQEWPGTISTLRLERCQGQWGQSRNTQGSLQLHLLQNRKKSRSIFQPQHSETLLAFKKKYHRGLKTIYNRNWLFMTDVVKTKQLQSCNLQIVNHFI